MCCLDPSVDTFFLLREVVKVHLYGRGEGLDDIFEWVAVNPVEEIYNLDRNFRISEKKWIDIALTKIL